jgi:hypothetical protein
MHARHNEDPTPSRARPYLLRPPPVQEHAAFRACCKPGRGVSVTSMTLRLNRVPMVVGPESSFGDTPRMVFWPPAYQVEHLRRYIGAQHNPSLVVPAYHPVSRIARLADWNGLVAYLVAWGSDSAEFVFAPLGAG